MVLEIKVLEIKVLESPARVGLPKVLRKGQQGPQAQAVAVNLSGAKRRSVVEPSVAYRLEVATSEPSRILVWVQRSAMHRI